MNSHFPKPNGTLAQPGANATGLSPQERRASRRQRVLYRALVVFDSKTMNCSIKDMSEHGCKLRFSVPPLLPEFFELRMQRPVRRFRCQLVWMSEREVGVRFVR